jgi:hypothetical protein
MAHTSLLASRSLLLHAAALQLLPRIIECCCSISDPAPTAATRTNTPGQLMLFMAMLQMHTKFILMHRGKLAVAVIIRT